MFQRFWPIFILCLFMGVHFSYGQQEQESEGQQTSQVNEEPHVNIDDFFRYANEPRISLEYNRGEHLIYDCKKQSFICVNKQSYERCSENRVKAREEKKRNLLCAPLLVLKDQKECFAFQITNIERARIKTYCYGEIKKFNL